MARIPHNVEKSRFHHGEYVAHSATLGAIRVRRSAAGGWWLQLPRDHVWLASARTLAEAGRLVEQDRWH